MEAEVKAAVLADKTGMKAALSTMGAAAVRAVVSADKA